MARKKPKVSLAQSARPRVGDLEKLFATDQDTEQASGLQLMAVRVAAIMPDPMQPRRVFPEESLQELSESIRQDGVIQPIEVTQNGPDRFMIVHGERRWRAAQLAGLETIPAIVRRRDYDEVTRFVRQLVENIQREDLNDLDRAAGLVRLRELLQEELDKAQAEGVKTDEPWGTKFTWAKVAKRLGYTRQRVSQLISLLKLPDEIKEAILEGTLSERETRIYQGLTMPQQRALHRARLAGDIEAFELKKLARQLKADPQQTVPDAIGVIRQMPTSAMSLPGGETAVSDSQRPLHSGIPGSDSTIIPPRSGAPTDVDRLGYIRSHLSRIKKEGLTAVERQEMVRLLQLIQQDVASLLEALQSFGSRE
jgi:ParB family chromosome partitioning protein